METLEQTLEELEKWRGDWPALCEEAGLPYAWLVKVAQRRIVEPQYSRIVRLQEALRARRDRPVPDPVPTQGVAEKTAPRPSTEALRAAFARVVGSDRDT